MKTHFISLIAVTGAVLFLHPRANAADGTWLGISGDWGAAGTWSGGTIADGADFNANFTGVNITADQIINVDVNRMIGNITFTDATTSSHNLTISGAGILTMDRTDATKPTINVTQLGRLLTINSVIAGNDGLLKSGAGTLVFGANSNNTFTGGFDISGGVVQYDSATNANAWGDAANVITFTGNATLHNNNNAYTLARGITVNSAVTATFSGAFGESTNVTGLVQGSGTMAVSGASNGWSLTLSNTANTFTGAISITNSSGSSSLSVASLGSSASVITIGNAGNASSFIYTGSAALSRGFAMGGTTGGATIVANGAGVLTASTFAVTGAGAKTLTLDGSSTATNQIAGNIVNNGGNTTVTKTGAGTWALSGTNTYGGVTNLAASGTTGRLVFQGSQSLSPNTSLVFAQSSSAVQSVRFLDDATGTINFARPISFGGTNTLQNLNIFVGNNNTTNLGSSSGTTTDSTIQAGSITFTSTAADTNTTTINVTGANGYRLETGAITLNNLVTRTAGQNTVTALNPTTANMTVASITMASGNTGIANDGVPILRLTGTSADNRVTGEISNATDYLTGQALSLQKQGTSTWTLSGVNTYAGSTAVSAGTLEIGGSGSLGSGSYAAAVSVTSTSTLRFNSTAEQTLSGVVSGASTAFLVKNNTGKLTLTNTNTFDGATTISGGILEVSGTGTINSSEVTLNGGNFRYNSSNNYTGTFTHTSGTISGTNWNGSLDNRTIGANQTISPGNSPGTASTGAQTWAAGGTYVWEINNVTSTAGSDPGWDLINGTGTLNITASIGTEFIIEITSLTLGNIAGEAVNFDQMMSYAWLMADFATITGFDATDFTLDTSGFANAYTGTFAVALGDTGSIGGDNTQIWLTYTAIPEPKAVLLGCVGVLLLLRRRR
ncbi:MAG: autotransporter-associated beta strand repeat-containing protein [Verrucomicrobiota bacterium]